MYRDRTDEQSGLIQSRKQVPRCFLPSNSWTNYRCSPVLLDNPLIDDNFTHKISCELLLQSLPFQHRSTGKKIKRSKRNLARLNQACLLKTSSAASHVLEAQPVHSRGQQPEHWVSHGHRPPCFLNRKQNGLCFY